MPIYHDMSNSYIKLEKEYFKNTAKSLKNQLNDNIENSDQKFKLSVIQDYLAKGLGFRNTDSLLHALEVKESNKKTERGYYNKFLAFWSEEKIISLFHFLLELNSGSAYNSGAKLLIEHLISALVHMRDSEEILLDVQVINQYLILDNLVKLVQQHRTFPYHIINGLTDYLSQLPSFYIHSKDRTNIEIANEQHILIQREFIKPLDILSKLEKNDPLIICPNWYHAVYHNDVSLNPQDNNIKSIYHTERLNDNVLINIYNKLNKDNYIGMNNNNKGGLNVMYTFLNNNDSKEVNLQSIELINPLAKSSYVDDTWLLDADYLLILQGLIQNKQLKNFHLSDLILYAVEIINPQKRALYFKFISILFKNYSSVVSKSQKLCDL